MIAAGSATAPSRSRLSRNELVDQNTEVAAQIARLAGGHENWSKASSDPMTLTSVTIRMVLAVSGSVRGAPV